MNHVIHPLSSADSDIFSPQISKFCYIKNTDIDSILLIISIYFNFPSVFKDRYNKQQNVSKNGYPRPS